MLLTKQLMLQMLQLMLLTQQQKLLMLQLQLHKMLLMQ